MTESAIAVKRRVLKWVLPRRGEAAWIGPGPVIAGEIQDGHAVVFTVEDDPETFDTLLEQGRTLASEREELIADGVDPAELVIPLAPVAVGRWVRTYRTGIQLPAGATHLISVGDGDAIRHVFEVLQPRGQEQP